MLLSLNDFQPGVHALTGANVLKNQLDTGEIGKPTILSAVKDSGAIDVSLEEGEQDDQKVKNIQDEPHQDSIYSDRKRHQGTQTELCSISSTDGLLPEQKKKGCE